MKTDLYQQAEAELDAYIERHNMRKTQERYQLLRAVCELDEAFTADELRNYVSAQMVISRATVYNILTLFKACQIIKQIDNPFGEREARYERTVNRGTTTQFVCTHCGRTVKFKDRNISNAVRNHRYTNFLPSSYSLYVYGECKTCRSAKKQ